MAYGEFGIFDKPGSDYGTPREHLNVLRAAANERASYLSQMDQFYAKLDEQVREFNKSLSWSKEQFGQELAWDKDKFGQNLAWDKEKFGEQMSLERAGLAQQAAQFYAGLDFQKEQFGWQQETWNKEFDYTQGQDTFTRRYYEDAQDRANESDWWSRGFGIGELGLDIATYFK